MLLTRTGLVVGLVIRVESDELVIVAFTLGKLLILAVTVPCTCSGLLVTFTGTVFVTFALMLPVRAAACL